MAHNFASQLENYLRAMQGFARPPYKSLVMQSAADRVNCTDVATDGRREIGEILLQLITHHEGCHERCSVCSGAEARLLRRISIMRQLPP